MSEIKEIIDSLEVKIEKLVSKVTSLENKNKELQVDLVTSTNKLETQAKEISTLQANLTSLKMVNSLLGSEENKRETKLKINSLIKEIDYCIAQLSE
jgi:chromosome segregation ATPase